MAKTVQICRLPILVVINIIIVAFMSSVVCEFAALDARELKIEEKELFVPSLEQLADALSAGLSKNYADLSVKVIHCPDLTEPPFDLASSGLSGSQMLLDVGDVSYRLPKANITKTYDFVNLAQTVFPNVQNVSFMGAGCGPYDQFNIITQGILSSKVIKNGYFLSKTRIEYLNRTTNALQFGTVPSSTTKFSLEGFYFASEGRRGKVIQIKAKKRVGKVADFSEACRKAVIERFGNKTIAVGGAFHIKSGSAYYHRKNIYDELSGPLVAVGRFVTNLPNEMDFNNLEDHFHGFSTNWGGHYHHDTNPDTIEYEAYFNVAERAIRIDQPDVKNAICIDQSFPSFTSMPNVTKNYN